MRKLNKTEKLGLAGVVATGSLVAVAFTLTGLWIFRESKIESKITNEFTTQNSVKVVESQYWVRGDSDTSRQVDLFYPNMVHVRAVDVGDDGVIDGIYVSENPAYVQIISLNPGREFMILPDTADIKRYLSNK
ncbi:hypothetical protein HYT23_01885 [Candidatus Pacearchaeota archaeon]|nr:hypothetical protein [Candidatus Pacearchaeota archaeon]